MNIIKYSILAFLILPLYSEVDYNSDIQPIFNNKCISCHIDGGTYFGGLDLSSFSEVMQGGDSGNTIIPFDHENSLLWQYVNSSYMPAYGSGIDPLSIEQIEMIAQWINEGALLESNEIEGRWIPGGFTNTMYIFQDGLRYTIYNTDDNFEELDIEDAIPNPNPYEVEGNTLSINLFYGTIATYTIDFRCDGQAVNFYYDEDDSWEGFHSTMFREGFDYINSECDICSTYNEEYCSWLPGCQWDYDLDVCFENSDGCSLTTDDILGPYYFEDAPFRSVIAHADEPGQRLSISGKVKQNDCENSISGSLIEVWQANDEGCYGIVEDCNTGNPDEDYFNLRGKFFSDADGYYDFESIFPGYYGSRPRHIHIKITTPNGEELISQLYFENDPYCENDPWCQDANDRIILLEENEFGLYGSMDFIINSLEEGIILGDLNDDEGLNIQDIILLVDIIIDDFISNDFQVYSGDLNYDYNLDVLDILQLVNMILN